MRKFIIIISLFLPACVTSQISPQDNAMGQATHICSQLHKPDSKAFYKCKDEKFSEYLPGHMANYNIQQQRQMQQYQALQAMSAQQQAYQAQEHRAAVYGANPEFANCMYNGMCQQNTRTTTKCRQIGINYVCESY